MKRSTRGTIKKLEKLSRLKRFADIRDRLLAVVGLKKNCQYVVLLSNLVGQETLFRGGVIGTAALV